MSRKYHCAALLRLFAIAVCLLAIASEAFAEPPVENESKTTVEMNALEKQFAESLSGATMTGQFTETMGKRGEGIHKEHYDLLKVEKQPNGQWLFQSRIKYGDHDLTIPLTLPVEWAGDTPVITVNDFPVPGLGKFTARVMIYSDHYAGFWKGAKHGGHLFGVIEKKAKE